ncbi:tRNA-specific adenosine deaminase [Paramyrothecium foliicola]|nr:tRNA-specific adenosine deaminase [Paramyrothecium foliicola]
MAAQDDATPWNVPVAISQHDEVIPPNTLPGRAYFSQLGVVRRKPARGDAPPTLSKSCSDKLALKQCTSLLSSITSLFINPTNAYLDTVILPESQFSYPACQRAFSQDGRMKPMTGRQWPGGYLFRPFSVDTTNVEFSYSRRSVQSRSSSISASNLAATWSRSGFEETLLGGILQGRKAFDSRGASKASKRQMWVVGKELATQLGGTTKAIHEHLEVMTYKEVKHGPLLEDRRRVKDDVRAVALTGWIRNEGGSDFSISPEK